MSLLKFHTQSIAILTACLAGTIVSVPGLTSNVASAQPIDNRELAREHYRQGKAFWSAQKYPEAIREFSEAHKLSPSPLLSYNIALCHDRMGNQSEALRYYRDYLSSNTLLSNRTTVEASVRRLESALQAKSTPIPPAPEPKVPAPKPPVVRQSTPNIESSGTPPAPTDEQTPAQETTRYQSADPELQRVDAIDVEAIQYQRSAYLQNRARAESEILYAEPAPADPVQQQEPPVKKKDDKAFYQQWWFWGIAGLGVYIVVDSLRENNTSEMRSQEIRQSPLSWQF